MICSVVVVVDSMIDACFFPMSTTAFHGGRERDRDRVENASRGGVGCDVNHKRSSQNQLKPFCRSANLNCNL